jgi:hypothetical protein
MGAASKSNSKKLNSRIKPVFAGRDQAGQYVFAFLAQNPPSWREKEGRKCVKYWQ